MRVPAALLSFAIAASVVATAENRGNCPPAPPVPSVATPKKAPPPPSTPDRTYSGTVILFSVISDKGYVCSAQVIRGMDKKTDAEAVTALRKWHFNPARKDGRPVPVLVSVDVDFWTDRDGKLVHSAPTAVPENAAANRNLR